MNPCANDGQLVSHLSWIEAHEIGDRDNASFLQLFCSPAADPPNLTGWESGIIGRANFRVSQIAQTFEAGLVFGDGVR